VRTAIGVDGEALTEAARELGTSTKVATVNEALKLAAARRRTAAYLDLVAELDLAKDDRDFDDITKVATDVSARWITPPPQR
jgi:Arc/MetJ family transcription regulator